MCKFSSGDTVGNQKLASDIGMKSENLSSNIEELLESDITSASKESWKDSKEDEDLLGSVGFTMSSGRPTMMSAKYLEKEERRKVLKISVNKLKRIEDPESSLRRSVLINNTMKRLQRETREEKQKNSAYKRSASPVDQLVDITNLPAAATATSKSSKAEPLGCKEPMPMDLLDSITAEPTYPSATPASRCAAGRKRSLDDIDDCDVTDVLSQFYMPPTPRLLTSISDDEDEELNVVDVDCSPSKKPRLEPCSDFSLSCDLSDSDSFRSTCSSLNRNSDFRTSDFPDLLLEPSPSLSLSPSHSLTPSLQSSQSSYSCGHSSVFSDIQSVVFHSLIASLET